LDRNALKNLAKRLSHPVVLVSGTNGKTTTTSLLAEVFRQVAGKVATNRAGANLTPGLVSALLETKKTPAIFEVDEGALPTAIEEVGPDFVVLLNLARDQLDRYGEIDTVVCRWLDALRRKDESRRLTLVANADDPRICHVAKQAETLSPSVRVVYFGIEAVPESEEVKTSSPDSAACPSCGEDLDYETAYATGGGHYSCRSCGFNRPQPHYSVSVFESGGMRGTRVQLECPAGATKFMFPLPGLHNVYNASASAAVATEAGLSRSSIERALSKTKAAYGRSEMVNVYGRPAYLLLSKNPQSISQNLRLVRQEAEILGEYPSCRIPLVFALNDRIADGRDISWIWDVDFSGILGCMLPVVACGDRAESVALRLVYDGWDPRLVLTLRDPYHALCTALSNALPGWPVPFIATYTAMRTLRADLVKRKLAPPIEDQSR